MSNPIESFDEQAVKAELRELVRNTIEEAINAMLDEEADQLVGAGPYERTDGRGRFRRHGLQPRREGVQGRGRMEMPASDLRIPVRLHRRYLPEA